MSGTPVTSVGDLPSPPPIEKGKPGALPDPPDTQPTDKSDSNVGTMEQLHNHVKQDIFPVPFEGAKFVYNKGLSQHFQVSHAVTMSNIEPPGYRFGATFVGRNKFSEMEVYPVMIGEMTPNGNLNAQIIHRPFDFYRFKYVAQIQSGIMVGQQLSNEFRGSRWNAVVTLINPDLVAGRLTGLADLMIRITGRLSLGSMYMFQKFPQIPGGWDGGFTFGGKLLSSQKDKWDLSLTVNPRPDQLSLHATYSIKVNESLQIGAELETDLTSKNNIATVGYQYDLQRANVSFKAQLDSNWNISSVLEKKLVPFPFTFALCSAANQVKSKYSIGVGLIVG